MAKKNLNVSISSQNEDVFKILAKISTTDSCSKSDYICKAIREKYERESPNYDDKERDLEKQIKKILLTLIGEGNSLFICSDPQPIGSYNIATTNVCEEKIEEIPEEVKEPIIPFNKNIEEKTDEELSLAAIFASM